MAGIALKGQCNLVSIMVPPGVLFKRKMKEKYGGSTVFIKVGGHYDLGAQLCLSKLFCKLYGNHFILFQPL